MDPALGLDHEWHRSRLQARRDGRGRPPPLVAAGFDLMWEQSAGRQIRVGGLAVIFGTFPATLADVVAFAKARMHLQADQARQLDAVLNARMMALWAWLPGPGRDCYLEFDRASGDLALWLLPGTRDEPLEELDPETAAVQLDDAFLEALVVNGNGGWGGTAGLARLIERFGSRPLLVAATVADRIDHLADPQEILDFARGTWPRLKDHDEAPWADMHGEEHPFICVQLGRLALRLGLLRAARLLIGQADAADASPVAFLDLGAACEALGDVADAEAHFLKVATLRPNDPEPWRRLLALRLRQGQVQTAGETLRRYRAAGGKDDDLFQATLLTLLRTPLRAEERALLAGWLGGRLDATVLASTHDAFAEILDARFPGDDAEIARAAHGRLTAALRLHFAGVGPAGDEAVEARVRSLAQVVLWTLPLLAPLHPTQQADQQVLVQACQRAVSWWCEQRLGLSLRWTGLPGWLGEWAQLATGSKP